MSAATRDAEEALLALDATLDRRALLLRAAAGLVIAPTLLSLLQACASQSREITQQPALDWPDLPTPGLTPTPTPPSGGWSGEVFPRTAWAKGAPIVSRMDPMKPVKRITIHHTAIVSGSVRSQGQAAAMMESIRRGHINRPGEPFGDIGYHYAVDPTGCIWEGRNLQWQGAHVAKQNEGNLGIVCMGNFETERPSPQQVSALNRFVVSQMRRFNVPIGQVRTHREMAATACPGRNLQPIVNVARAKGGAMTFA